MYKLISLLLVTVLATPFANAAEKDKTKSKPAKTTAPAQTNTFSKGDKFLGLSASYTDAGPVTLTALSGSFDLFIQDNMSVGGSATYASTDYGFGSTDTLALAARGRMFFAPQGVLTPFAGAGANIYDDSVDSYLNLTAEAGILQPLVENVYIEYSAHYWLALDSNKDNTFTLMVGLQVALD